MPIDFTLNVFSDLLITLQKQGFSFQSLSAFIQNPGEKTIILRHDVDLLPRNSLTTAQIEHELGVTGSYYFRVLNRKVDEICIKEISGLGHEIGYHYEDISLCASTGRQKGLRYGEEELAGMAIESFKENLNRLRQLVPVETICVHGSPMSRWDSRLLWKYNDYHDFGIIGEPYFDIDYDKVLYLTDTARRWDGDRFNIRDKTISLKPQAERHRPKAYFHSTSDIIKAANKGQLPEKIMINFHPQRWTNEPLPWVKELVWQNVKNVGKYFLIKVRR